MRHHAALRTACLVGALLLGAACGSATSRAEEGSVVGGGGHNVAGGFNTVIAGGSHNRTTNSHSTVSGGSANVALGIRSTVGGGGNNLAERIDSTVGGGSGNLAQGFAATVAGGTRNSAASYASVGGGLQNAASGGYSEVAGGVNNLAGGFGSTVSGGAGNQALGINALVAGGLDGSAPGDYAVVSGGRGNVAAGDYSLAAGHRAIIAESHAGAFVFADSSPAAFHSRAADEFAVRATGGARMVTAVDAAGEPLAGVVLPAGSGSWSSMSSRAAKSRLTLADGRQILQVLQELPIYTWSYVAQDPSVRHIGPTAEDFYASYGFGDDQRYISAVDAQGIALAAVQALQQSQLAAEAQLHSLETENRQLEQRVAALERAILQTPASRQFVSAPLASAWPSIAGLLAGIVIGAVGKRRFGATS